MLIGVLEQHSGDAKSHPDVKEKIDKHIGITKEHATKVENCLGMLEESAPDVKSSLAKASGSLEGIFMDMGEDKVLKNAVAEYSSENREIAIYKIIKSIAEECERDDIAKVADSILEDEIEMANWLSANIKTLVIEHINEESE